MDTELGNGDLHEEKFNSGEFLQQLNDILTSDVDDVEKFFVSAEAYVYASAKRVLHVSQELCQFINSSLSTNLESKRKRIQEKGSSGNLADSSAIRERAARSSRQIDVMETALLAVHDSRFTDQIEKTFELATEMLNCGQSMRYQIAIYDEELAHHAARAKEESLRIQEKAEQEIHNTKTYSQNSWMIVGTFIGVIIALAALFIALDALDNDKRQALFNWIFQVKSAK